MRRFLVIIALAVALLSVTGIFAQEEPGIPLQIIDSMPFTGEELGLDSPITLFFDRPVDCDTARNAINITPAIGGSLECTDAQVQFVPEVPYDGATTYSIQVKDTLRAADGGALL